MNSSFNLLEIILNNSKIMYRYFKRVEANKNSSLIMDLNLNKLFIISQIKPKSLAASRTFWNKCNYKQTNRITVVIQVKTSI